MASQAEVSTLRNLGFFQGVADEHLQQLASISQELDFPDRQMIFQEDDPAKAVYVVVSGNVSLVICLPSVGCRQIMELGSGDLFGWSPLLGRPRLSDTARTLTPTKVVAFDGKQLLELCTQNYHLGFDVMCRLSHVLADRLTATRRQLLEKCGVHFPEVGLESD